MLWVGYFRKKWGSIYILSFLIAFLWVAQVYDTWVKQHSYVEYMKMKSCYWFRAFGIVCIATHNDRQMLRYKFKLNSITKLTYTLFSNRRDIIHTYLLFWLALASSTLTSPSQNAALRLQSPASLIPMALIVGSSKNPTPAPTSPLRVPTCTHTHTHTHMRSLHPSLPTFCMQTTSKPPPPQHAWPHTGHISAITSPQHLHWMTAIERGVGGGGGRGGRGGGGGGGGGGGHGAGRQGVKFRTKIQRSLLALGPVLRGENKEQMCDPVWFRVTVQMGLSFIGTAIPGSATHHAVVVVIMLRLPCFYLH